nr:RNA polymerase b'-subunit [Chlamydomonas sp. UWO 241]
MTVSKKEKKFYTSYSKLSEVKLITIGLASPERIKQWAEKTLPNGKILGEVINANTLHHKTFKPQKGGLFCERIFGPLKDFECACGKPLKYKKALNLNDASIKLIDTDPNKSILGNPSIKTRNFCNICEVEYTWSVMRRYQLGYIKLISPITHVWYLKGNPSYLSILLDIKKRHLESVTYCSESLTIENTLKGKSASSNASDIVSSWKKLKEQIITSKISNLTPKQELTSKIYLLQTKLRKRDQLNISKQNAWLPGRTLNGSTQSNEFLPEIKNLADLKQLSFSRIQDNHLNLIKSEETTPTSLEYEFGLYPRLYIPLQGEVRGVEGDKSRSKQVFEKHDFSSQTGSQRPNLMVQIKNYFQTINFKSLLKLYIIFKKIKKTKINNNFETFLLKNKSSKQILKNISIPYYILFKANQSNKFIFENAIQNIWSILSKKAVKKALLRVNKIFNKVDSAYFYEQLTGLPGKLESKNIELILSELSSKHTLNPLMETSTGEQSGGNTKGVSNSLKLERDYLKLIKNYVSSLIFESLDTPYISHFVSPPYKEENIGVNGVSLANNSEDLSLSTLNSNNATKQFTNVTKKDQVHNFNLSAKNKKNFIFYSQKRSSLYLKFSTLSKFANKNVSCILNYQTSHSFLNLKEYKKIYKFLFKKITKICFNIFLKSNELVLKNILNVQSNNPLTSHNNLLSNDLIDAPLIYPLLYPSLYPSLFPLRGDNRGTFEAVKQGAKSEIKKQDFNQFLKMFTLIKKNDNQKQLQLKSFENKPQSMSSNSFFDALKTSSVGLKKQGLLFRTFELNTTLDSSKNLYNNIYSLSHRERWEGENDWNFLYYFITAPFNEAPLIPNYKNRYENILSMHLNDSDLNFQNISGNLKKSAFFSGPGIIQQLLTEFNFYEIKKMDKQNRILLYQLNKQIFKLKRHSKHDRSAKKELKEAYKKRDLLIRRTKLIRKLFIKESAPLSTILTTLPVLPPDLRPIVKMGGQIAASDLNRLYQRVIYRNDRLKKFLKDPATSHSYEMKYAQRLLQEAVDNLIQNGKTGVVSEKDSRGRALKSLSDILKGKQGRFRQYLLGKRVDYSGRSVIVVGPKLKLHECGIPKEMALELYLPFLLKRILNENLAKTVVGAKTLIKTNPSFIWELLREIMQTCPVLLNRAPTLHRLGIQAFQPKLIDGRAILLHPLVCSAFNADFDGDQMAVHVPITVEARAEAWKLMLSRNNILSPATGEPLAMPSQDMVLGCYYLTTNLLNKKTTRNTLSYNPFYRGAHKGVSHALMEINLMGSGVYYSNREEALRDYDLKKIDLHSNIWLKWNNLIENGMDQEEPIEIRVDYYGNWKEISNKMQKTYTSQNDYSNQYILTTPGKILFNQLIQKALTS